MTTLSELTTPLTPTEVETAIYAAIAARGTSTTSWKPGAVARTIIFGVAIVLSALSQLSALIAKSGFLELAEGSWLTLLAYYVYDVTRVEGTFATGTITVNNTAGGVYSGGADDLVARRSSDGKTYRATAAWSIGALETGVVIPVEATEMGSDSSAIANAVDELETTMLGVVVVASSAMVGSDREEDPALRARALAKTGVLSPDGPRDAYNFVCLSAVRADGTSIGITRVRSIADGDGNVDVYVADADGTAISAPDLAILQEEVETKAEPLAVTATVVGATAVAIPVTWELWVRDTSGLTNAQIEDLVNERLLAFMSAQPIGGLALTPGGTRYVFVSAIESVIGSAASSLGSTSALREVRVVVTAPAADVAIGATEAPVLGTVTVVGVHQVTGGTF